MRSRRLSQSLLAGGAIALALGGFAPTIASAASNNDTLTVAGGSSYTYTFNQSPSIQATAQPNCQPFSAPGNVTLSVSGPAVTNGTLVTHRGDCNKAISMSPSASSVNTAHPAWTGGSIEASNGVYTVTLNNQGRTKSAQFTLLIPPVKPSNFGVTPNSPTSATFTWSANPEPDITGYEIDNSTGTVATEPSSACTGGSCSSGPIDLGSGVSGRSEQYSLTALRSCGDAPCSAGHLASPSAANASATFPAPPKPTPTPTPTKSNGGSGGSSGGSGGNGGNGGNGGGGNGGGGGTTSLGTVTSDGGGGNGGGGNGGGVNLGNADAAGQVSHNLPPATVNSVPQVNAPPLPGVQTSIRPLDPGAAPGTIQYPAPLVAQKNEASKGIVQDLKSGLSWRPLWRGIAAAAVLLLIAVHLRAWVSRTEAF